MIQNLKKIGLLALCSSLVFAQTGLAYSTLDSVQKTDGEILSDALVNTFNSDFTATINSDISVNGVDIDNWNETKTVYIIDAKATDVMIKKSGDSIAYTVNGANIDFSINSDEEKYAKFFPFKGTVNWSEQAILNFETFQFAFKGLLNTIEIDNSHINNLIGGFLEIEELLENKWISLDFVELNNTFPELETFIADIQDDLSYELDIDDIESAVDYLAIGIDFAVETGELVIVKSGNVYTLTVPEKNIVITVVTSNNKISSVSVQGNERWEDYDYSETNEYSDVEIDVKVEFSYYTPSIVFPKIEEKDFDITAFYKMYLEIKQVEILEEQKENQFYLDLNVFAENVNEAVTYLTKNGNKTDIEFLREYLTNAKNLNRRIRLSDIQQLSAYGLDEWDIDYLYEDIKYDVNKGLYSSSRYDDKYILENFLEIFDSSNIRLGYKSTYHYIDWDIFEKLEYSISTRGDILILLAKIRTAEQLRDNK
ncbi:TPA: hypothetical protein EYG96_01875 [Candidatus Gracilibacteria bacterium]|nr:hypothetical protein [Candidatus Peregrinibacteria bacterium]HIQ56771.1 hypothetical protein [Candidatus Gracilibacteria bacterium]HIQ57353.1 hypothetical protein [Candidatus Gracilibacteria bacterium]